MSAPTSRLKASTPPKAQSGSQAQAASKASRGVSPTAAPQGVTVMTDIKSYLDFVIGMLFAFGLAFQVPIAIVIVVWTGLVSRKSLAKSRPYVFLGAFVVGMILTPPDVFSQTLLALPMYALYEAALLFCWRFMPDRA